MSSTSAKNSKVKPPPEGHSKNPVEPSSRNSKSQAAYLRSFIFVFPPIGKWESLFYWVVLMALQGYACYAVYDASCHYFNSPHRNRYVLHQSTWIPEWLAKFTPGQTFRDGSNWEWNNWSSYFFWEILPWAFGHFLIFNFGQKLLPNKLHDAVCLIFWLMGAVQLTSAKMVGFVMGEMLLVFAIARLTRSVVLIWATVAAFLYIFTGQYFWLANLIGGFGEMSKNSPYAWNSFPKDFFKMLYYAFYLPYAYSVVRIYPYFEKEIIERQSKIREWKSALFFGFRIFLWAGCTEMFQHVLFSEAMITNAAFLSTVPIDRLIAIGYFSLHFFHLKYVCIFGLPQFWAKLDNMKPPDLPMCPGHVSMYSKTWRYFDIGLYDFFKNYIYIPIASPTFTILRKLVGFCVIYLFVLLWHGFEHQYVIWILISMMEIWSEIVSKIVYVQFLKTWREKHMSDVAFRRILAVLHLWPSAVGCYASFYFLGGAASGWVYADRIFWKLTLPPRWQVWLMFVYGYFFNQVGFDVTVYHHRKAMEKRSESHVDRKKQ